MRHVAAYLLAVLGGNENPTAKDITSILNSVGVEVDKKNLDIVVAQLKGKNVEEVMEEGRKLMADVPAGGGGGAVAAAPAAAAAAEAPKKEKTPEPSEDSDEDMGLGLFD